MLAKLLTPKNGTAGKTPSTPAIAIATPQRNSRNFEAEFYLANAFNEIDAENFKASGKSRSPSFRTTPMLLEAMSAYYDEDSPATDGYAQQDNSLLTADVAAIVDIDASSPIHHHAPNDSSTSSSSSNENGEDTSDSVEQSGDDEEDDDDDEEEDDDDAGDTDDDKQFSAAETSMSGNSSLKEARTMETTDTGRVSPPLRRHSRTAANPRPAPVSVNHDSISSQLDRVLRRRASIVAAGTSKVPKLRLISRMQTVDSRALLEQVAVGSIAPTVLTVDGGPGRRTSASPSSAQDKTPSEASTLQQLDDSEIPKADEPLGEDLAEIKNHHHHHHHHHQAGPHEGDNASIDAIAGVPLPGGASTLQGLSPSSEFSTLRVSTTAENSKSEEASSSSIEGVVDLKASLQPSTGTGAKLQHSAPAEEHSAYQEELGLVHPSSATLASSAEAPNTAPPPPSEEDVKCSGGAGIVADSASDCRLVPHAEDVRQQKEGANPGPPPQPDEERPRAVASRRARSKRTDVKCKCLIQ